MKTICAQGCFCYICDHGLVVGDQYHCDLTADLGSTIDLCTAFEKFLLFIKASKNSIVTNTPFLFMFQITDFSAPTHKKQLYTCFVLFKPTDCPNSIVVSIKDTVDSPYSIRGHVPRSKAAVLLDDLFHDFLTICQELVTANGCAHIL
jgi:hypothetical protein